VSEKAYVKHGVPIIVASIGRDKVGLSIFLGDRIYRFSLRKTNLKNDSVKKRFRCPVHIGFEGRTTSHDLRPWLNLCNYY